MECDYCEKRFSEGKNTIGTGEVPEHQGYLGGTIGSWVEVDPNKGGLICAEFALTLKESPKVITTCVMRTKAYYCPMCGRKLDEDGQDFVFGDPTDVIIRSMDFGNL